MHGVILEKGTSDKTRRVGRGRGEEVTLIILAYSPYTRTAARGPPGAGWYRSK